MEREEYNLDFLDDILDKKENKETFVKKGSKPEPYIPIEMRKLDQWVTWKLVKREGQPKPTKPPFQVNGANADSTDPSTWTSFKNVEKLERKGFMFSENDPFVFIDLDDCFDEQGNLKQWGKDIYNKLNSYTEISPSLKGLHIFVKGKHPKGEGNKRAVKDVNNNKIGEIEIYDKTRYSTITGELYGTHKKIESRQKELNEIHRTIFAHLYTEEKVVKAQAETTPLTNNEVITLATNSKTGSEFQALYKGNLLGFPSHSEADYSLAVRIAFYTKDVSQVENIMRGSQLYRPKWDTKRGNKTWIQRQIADAVSKTHESYTPSQAEPDPEFPQFESKKTETISEGLSASPMMVKRYNILKRKMQTFSQVQGLDIPEPEVLIDGLLYEGISMLMAPEKIGKSTVARQMCYQLVVSDEYITNFHGNVNTDFNILYISYEDDNKGFKSAVNRLNSDQPVDTPHMRVIYEWDRINEGGFELLEMEIVEKKTNLIIIDTWGYFRSKRGSNKTSFGEYEEDLDDIKKLRDLHMKYGVHFIIITHTTKAPHEYRLHNVHGGVGQTASVNNVIHIAKNLEEEHGSLFVIGKYFAPSMWMCSLKPNGWRLTPMPKHFGLSENQLMLWDCFLRENNKPMSPKTIHIKFKDDLGKSVNAIKLTLTRMLNKGTIIKKGYGIYMMKKKHYEDYREAYNLQEETQNKFFDELVDAGMVTEAEIENLQKNEILGLND